MTVGLDPNTTTVAVDHSGGQEEKTSPDTTKVIPVTTGALGLLPTSKATCAQKILYGVKLVAAIALFIIAAITIVGCYAGLALGLGGAIALACIALICFVIVLFALQDSLPGIEARAMRAQLHKFANENDKLQKTSDNLQEEVTRLKGNLEELQGALTRLGDLSTAMEQHTSTSEELAVQCRGTLEGFKGLRLEIQELLEPVSDLTQSLDKLLKKEDIKKLTDQLAELTASLAKTNLDITTANGILAETKAQVVTQKAILAELKNQITTLRLTVNQLQAAATETTEAQRRLVQNVQGALQQAAPQQPQPQQGAVAAPDPQAPGAEGHAQEHEGEGGAVGGVQAQGEGQGQAQEEGEDNAQGHHQDQGNDNGDERELD